MVTRIHKDKPRKLYISEWMDHLDLDDQRVSGRVAYYDAKKDSWVDGVTSTTIYRWAREQERLDPYKIEGLAKAMGLDGPESLYRPPPRQSVDAVLKDAPDHIHEAALAYARLLVGNKAS